MQLNKKYISIAVSAMILGFGLNGCSTTQTKVESSNNALIDKYLSAKATGNSNLNNRSIVTTNINGEKVVSKNNIERYFNINIGDTTKTIFERLSLLENKVYIVDADDFRSSFVAPGIKSFEDVKKFYKANGVNIMLNEIPDSKYVKVSFTNSSLSEIEKTLSSFQVQANGSIPLGVFLQDIASKAKLSISYSDKTAKNISTITKNINVNTDGLNAIKQVANSADLDVKINDKTIELSYFKTEVLNLDIFTRDRTIANSIVNNTALDNKNSSSSNSGVNDSKNSKDLEVVYVTGLVKELRKSIESLLSPHGTYEIMPSSGQIVVKDRADHVKSIQKTVNSFNAQFKDTVELTLTFYKVTTQKGDKRGLDFRALNGKLAATATGMTSLAGLSSTTGSIASAFGLEYSGSGGRSVLFNLLSEFGSAEVMNPVDITTQSNMLKTVKIANNFGYIASIDTTTNTNSGTTASIEPSSVPDGMFFSLLAKPIDNNYIAVDIYATNNSFVKFNTATAFGSTVQTPDTAEQSVDGYHQLQNGIPQILVSHKYEENKLDESGLPIKFLKSLGYKEDSSKDTYVVIALEARVK